MAFSNVPKPAPAAAGNRPRIDQLGGSINQAINRSYQNSQASGGERLGLPISAPSTLRANLIGDNAAIGADITARDIGRWRSDLTERKADWLAAIYGRLR